MSASELWSALKRIDASGAEARVCKLAEALQGRGLKVSVGDSWDGHLGLPSPVGWYVYPREGGGVGVHHVEEEDGVWLEPGDVDLAVRMVGDLPMDPSHEAVWKALEWEGDW